MDELEWKRVDASLTPEERDQGVTALIDLVVAVDGMLQAQSAADADYFMHACDRSFSQEEATAIKDGVLRAYRWQYIVSGVKDPRFTNILMGMLTPAQAERVTTALAPLM